MSSKKHLDFGSMASDVAHTIEDAMSRTEALARQRQASGSAAAVKPLAKESAAPQRPESQATKNPMRKPRRMKQVSKTPAETKPKTTRPDPWVNATFKVRDSKRQRLHKLHLTRQLEGLTPYTKQDFLDEALDYLLAKYEGRCSSSRSTE